MRELVNWSAAIWVDMYSTYCIVKQLSFAQVYKNLILEEVHTTMIYLTDILVIACLSGTSCAKVVMIYLGLVGNFCMLPQRIWQSMILKKTAGLLLEVLYK